MRKELPFVTNFVIAAALLTGNVACSPQPTISQKTEPQKVFIPTFTTYPTQTPETFCQSGLSAPTVEGFVRAPELDVPERHIVGYTQGEVQVRTYSNAISYVWVPNQIRTEVVECSIPSSIARWLNDQMLTGLPEGLDWVKNKNFDRLHAVLTPEPLDKKIMLAINW